MVKTLTRSPDCPPALAQFENMAIIRRLISPSLLTKVFVKNAAVGLLLS